MGSWEELPGLIQRTVMQYPGVLPVIVGNKFGNPADNEVSQSEVSEAEASWSIPIVRIRHQSQNPAPGALPEVAAALNTICEQLYLAKPGTSSPWSRLLFDAAAKLAIAAGC